MYHKQCECGQKLIFCKSKKGKDIPVNVESLSEHDIKQLRDNHSVAFRYGEHISHFSDCPNASKFRKGRND